MTNCLPNVEFSGISIAGPVREDNQDSIYLPDPDLARNYGQLFAIADGMGGYSLGNIASRMAIDSVSSAVYSMEHPNPSALKTGIDRANLQVYNTAIKNGVGRMGTTITAAYVIGDTLHLGHIGDSRAYMVRNGRSTCLTVDHTQVGEMVRAKLLSPDRVRTHASRSVLTRAVGIDLFVRPDITNHHLQEGDRIILCTDGVWSVIEDVEFGTKTKNLPVEMISQSLIDLALTRETDDNASVIAFEITGLSFPVINPPPRKIHWLQKLRKMI
ncbi:protein-serine/threonine phosphatase [Leptolinea sp. HRD-7]|nr:protein-serine/threonine phosphatase [Leptolinea sp. HRD-7]